MTLLDGLYAYWKFDGNSTDELTSHTGTDSSGLTYGAEKINSGVRFTDSKSITIDTLKIAHDEFTFDSWIKPGTVVSLTGGLFTDTNKGLYFVTATSKLQFVDMAAVTYTSAATFTLGELAHIAITLVDGTLTFYKNGVFDSEHTGVTWPGAGGFYKFGRDFFSQQFIGSMDEAAYWTRALTSEEISRRYGDGAGLAYSHLLDPVPLSAVVARYSRTLKQLLPPGQIRDRIEADSVLSNTMIAAAGEFVRIDARGVDLGNESDPRTADETIADWERIVGLPDEQVTEIPATLALRRLAVTQKYVARGGQSVSFFTGLALSMGYVVTLLKTQVLRVGFRVSDRVYGAGFAYSLEILVAAPTGTVLPQADFERVMRHHTHSHITLIFTYA